MLNESTQLLLASASNKDSGTPLTFITGLKYETNVVKALNNITFLYDPNWQYESKNATYPISFFYVEQFTEEMTSEISQKPMLFYNSESTESTDGVKGSLLNIVSDNIIIKPKTYKLKVIIPMNIDSFLNFSLSNITNVNAFILTKGKKDLSYGLNVASKTIGILRTLFTALYGVEVSASSIFTMLCEQQEYNKNSIEYMWRNRRIIKMKLWTGWQFKYLVIQNFEVTKQGEAGEFFEGNLVCQEVPILTLRPSSKLATTQLSKVSSVLGKGIKIATEGFINAMEATAGVRQQ